MTISDRYNLIKQLGEGGFGEVWKALDQVTGKYVAIKIHHKGDTDYAAREIVKEYTRVMNIHHDNLLTPSHVDITNGNVPYLVMELCEYDISERDLTETEVWQLLRDVASGLKRLADNKRVRVRSDGSTSEVSDPIIHQDIKPANILLRSNGMYAISDFGISKHRLSTLSTNDQNGQTQQMDSAMTVDYAAPERFPRGVGKAVLASDIWSLGAMLFEIVEGRRPFADGGGDCLNHGFSIPTITREGFSDELKIIIYDCMAKVPADRPTAAQLTEYAGKVLNGEPRVRTWEQHMSNPPSRPWRRWVYVAAAAVGVLLVTALILKYGFDSGAQTDIADTISDTIQVAELDTGYGKWTGEEMSGKPVGEGTLYYYENDNDGRLRYEGNMNQGLRDDNNALLVYANGNTYQGSFVNDQFGVGTLTLKDDGLIFEGEFKNDAPYNGTWRWNDGTEYSKVVKGIEK